MRFALTSQATIGYVNMRVHDTATEGHPFSSCSSQVILWERNVSLRNFASDHFLGVALTL